jgi:hypothetical protein
MTTVTKEKAKKGRRTEAQQEFDHTMKGWAFTTDNSARIRYAEDWFSKHGPDPKREHLLAKIKQKQPGETEVKAEPVEPQVKIAKVESAPTEKPAKSTNKKAPAQKAEKSLSRRLKEIVVVEPKITIDTLYDRLVAEGYVGRSKVTVATLRSDAITTLQVAVDAGKFPPF